MTAPQKLNMETVLENMRVFLDFPQVEENLRDEVCCIVNKIILSKAQNGGRPPLDVMVDYLNAGADTNDRLKFIVGLSGGSMERIKRVYEAIFPGENFGKIKQDADVRQRVASFLINPNEETTFIPSFVRESFSLPVNWIQLLQEKEYLQAVARNILQSKYAVNMGIALEECVCGVTSDCGYDSQKGAVAIVDNKEVDIAIPNLESPRILIMSSYQLTTASSQSSKANEQARMYQDVQTHNRRRRQINKPEVLFVNIVDGGGWLDRKRDLRRMWLECDYCFPHADLHELRIMLNYFMEND